MRKAQAALEFLTTYGWAFLVILIMIAALAYFGILNPGKVLPDKCLLGTGFDCREFRITEDDFTVIVINRQGQPLKNVSVDVSSIESAEFITAPTSCTIAPGTVIGTDGEFNITCAATDMLGDLADEKVDIKFVITYIPLRATFEKKSNANIYSIVQP